MTAKNTQRVSRMQPVGQFRLLKRRAGAVRVPERSGCTCPQGRSADARRCQGKQERVSGRMFAGSFIEPGSIRLAGLDASMPEQRRMAKAANPER